MSFSSLDAPTKFVPWSENISWGNPHREVNRLSAARNVSVERSETGSKCAAFVASTQTHRCSI